MSICIYEIQREAKEIKVLPKPGSSSVCRWKFRQADETAYKLHLVHVRRLPGRYRLGTGVGDCSSIQ